MKGFWKIFFLLIVPGALLISIAILLLSSKARIAAAKAFSLIYPKLRGIRNNNPGNLRASADYTWQGQTGKDEKGFAVFERPEDGIRAMAVTALHKQTRDGITNLTDFGNSWAPPADNQGASDYGLRLANRLGTKPDDSFDLVAGDPFTVSALSKAITKNEEGINPYPDSMFDDAAGIALAKIEGEAAA